jgi:fatty-acyl-CoA synthase
MHRLRQVIQAYEAACNKRMEVPLSPIEFARRARSLYADREAVVDGGVRLTYKQFCERCDRWSSALQSMGIRKGDRVAYIAPNTHSNLEAYYAIPQLGAVLVPLNYRLIADDFAYMISHSGARVVCAHPDYFDAVDSVRSQISCVEQFVALEGEKRGWLNYEEILAASSAEYIPAPISETDLLTINYTSGTTSRPKGVMITHRNAYMNAVGVLIHCHMTCADRYLWTLPMFHANGWTFVWIVTAVGGTHVCLRKVEPKAVFDLVSREAVTILCAAPTVLIAIANVPEELRRDCPSGVRVLTAGAPPAAATIGLVEKQLGWEIIHVYGATETSPLITICEPRPEHGLLTAEERTQIKARQGVELVTSGELKVVDSAGQEVPHDGETIGEVISRGNLVMHGYYQDPEATAKAIRDGWYHMGDAAVVHPDGYIEIRDRLKDVIISGGENISSVEVEGILLRHPAIQEVAVVGLPHEKWGEAPQAFVVLKAGAAVSEAELNVFARERMAGFKVPKGFTFLTELPKTATGKIQKYVLRGKRPAMAKQ